MGNRIRNIQLHFMVDEQERKIIDSKMGLIGTTNLGAYLRRMAIYGYMIELDMEPLNKLTVELSRIGNNLNQLAKRANETGNVYGDDIEALNSDIKAIKEDIRSFTTTLFDDGKYEVFLSPEHALFPCTLTKERPLPSALQIEQITLKIQIKSIAESWSLALCAMPV